MPQCPLLEALGARLLMRPRVIMVLAIAAILLGGVMLVPAAYARLSADLDLPTADPTPTPPPPPPPPTLAAAPVSVQVDGFYSWALLDRATGEIAGSKNVTATNSTESMIKVWIVSDYLRQLGGEEPPAERLRQASTAIRDSNDDSAGAIYRAAGGDKSLDRMISMCRLTETRKVIPPGSNYVWWSYTRISARDAVRLGQCVADGTAAGPKWSDWVLEEMSKVRGTTAKADQQRRQGGGRWGIIDGLPAEIREQDRVSIKNGWTLINADGQWHLNCLAVTDKWVLAVLMRYPGRHGLNYGAKVCASVTSQLVAPQPGAAVKVPQPLAKG